MRLRRTLRKVNAASQEEISDRMEGRVICTACCRSPIGRFCTGGEMNCNGKKIATVHLLRIERQSKQVPNVSGNFGKPRVPFIITGQI